VSCFEIVIIGKELSQKILAKILFCQVIADVIEAVDKEIKK
jgi:hypothetical protein